MLKFFAELKRRRVIRVAVAYLLVAWLLAQITDVTFEPLGLPRLAATFVIVLLIMGFPVMLVLAWAFDITPEGIKKTADTDKANLPWRAASPLASVAVLPFQHLPAQSPHAFLADAIAEELRNSLSRVADLRVVSGHSASAQAAQQSDLPSLANALNVQYVISGTVTEVRDKIRLVSQLYDAARDTLLWSNSYDVSSEDLLRVQQELAESIAGVFGGERLRVEVARAQALAPKTDLKSWELVQKAKAYLIDYRADRVDEAVPLLKRAVRLDPKHAAAQSTLGLVMAERTLNAISADAAADRATAITAVNKAERLAPQDPVVLRAASVVHAYNGAYRRSIELLRRAVAIAPYDLGAWGYFGWPLVATGRREDLDELQTILDRLIKTAPQHPGYGYWLFHRSVAHACARQLERARDSAEESVRQQPQFALGWMNYANILGRLHQPVQARAALQRCIEINPRMTPQYYSQLMRVLSDRPEVVESRVSGLREAGLLSAAKACAEGSSR